MAFEMAQMLEKEGENVPLLALIDTPTPEVVVNAFSQVGLLKHYADRILDRIDLELSNLEVLSTKERLDYCWERTRTLFSIARFKIEKIVQPILPNYLANREKGLAYRLQVLREAHAKASREYRPRPYRGNIALFRVSHPLRGFDSNGSLGWGDLVSGKLEVHEVPGYHKNILKEPRVEALAVKLKQCLKAAGAGFE